MVTTNRRVPVDAFESDPHGLIHLTGSLQIVARVTLGGLDGAPAHAELLLDAAQVRGMGKEGDRATDSELWSQKPTSFLPLVFLYPKQSPMGVFLLPVRRRFSSRNLP